MDLRVQLFAVLRERAGQAEWLFDELPDGLTMGELKAIALERIPSLESLEAVAGVVGTEYVEDERVLLPGDQVALLPPVSGGEDAVQSAAPEALDYEMGVFRLHGGGIQAAGLEDVLVEDHCGGLVTFRGLTRRTSRGREDVQYLDYEVFEGMAEPEMARIFEECRQRFGEHARGPLRMLCLHSQGRVLVGETSVLVAVATPHRDTAFEACRFLIDTLKERLPIWKKEVCADGGIMGGRLRTPPRPLGKTLSFCRALPASMHHEGGPRTGPGQ